LSPPQAHRPTRTLRARSIAFLTWVKGHAGTPGNEHADRLAGSPSFAVVCRPSPQLRGRPDTHGPLAVSAGSRNGGAGFATPTRRTTKYHVLLHRNGDCLELAREGRRPPSILADPRWEARLLRFLELSGVGGIVDEEDVKRETNHKSIHNKKTLLSFTPYKWRFGSQSAAN